VLAGGPAGPHQQSVRASQEKTSEEDFRRRLQKKTSEKDYRKRLQQARKIQTFQGSPSFVWHVGVFPSLLCILQQIHSGKGCSKALSPGNQESHVLTDNM
jgi:hypothetical protein